MAWLWDITRTEAVNPERVSRFLMREWKGARDSGVQGFEVVAVETIHAHCDDRRTVLAVVKEESAALGAVREAVRLSAGGGPTVEALPSTPDEWDAWIKQERAPEPF